MAAQNKILDKISEFNLPTIIDCRDIMLKER